MIETSLKSRIVAILIIILAIALFLQSIVLINLNVRASISEDTVWAKNFLQKIIAADVTNIKADLKLDFALKEYRDVFPCIFVEVKGDVISESSMQCRFREELMNNSQKIRTVKTPIIDFAGGEWKISLFSSEVALISVPLEDNAGQIYGSINVERSLQTVYSRYQKDLRIAFSYLIVNVVIFSCLGFFRLVRIFFRPLDKLVRMAENYHPDEQSLLPFRDDESAFRKLTVSLNELLSRIERDNRKLRNTVSRLEHSNRELKEKNDLVIRSEKLASAGRLSAGLAHEIGNPLSIIQGYVELLGRDDLSPAEKTLFSMKAQQELDRIKNLIKQLLDFSRPVSSAKNEVAVNELIDEVINFFFFKNSAHSCQIRVELRAEEDEIIADNDALRQVLVNVIFNAIDATAAMAEKDREIVVATENEVSGTLGPVIIINVKDNGIGIDNEHLREVFDPFFTTKEVGRGTGLGLYVCHTILDHFGGHITISNRIPAGVEVKIQIPLQKRTSSPHDLI